MQVFLPALSVTVRRPKGTGLFLVWPVNSMTTSSISWKTGTRSAARIQDTSAIMQPIAHRLTRAQMEAVAAYLNYLD